MPLKRISWMTGLILMLASVSQAALVGPYTTQYYVSQFGYDLNDGLSTATSFASVTRAVEVLNTLDGTGSTATARVVIAAGAYLSDGLTFTWNNFTRVDWEGDTAGAWFIGQTGPVRIQNDTNNPLNYLLFINRPAMRVELYSLEFWSANSTTLVNMIEINSNTVFVQDCQFNYFINGATNGLQSVVYVNGSQSVTLNRCRIFFDDQLGNNTGWVRMLFLDTSSILRFDNCTIFSRLSGGPPILPHVYVIQTTQSYFSHCQVYTTSLPAQTYGFNLTPTSFNTTLDACGVSRTGIGVVVDQANQATVQNSWLQNNTVGLRLNNANTASVMNNVISNNTASGVDLDGMCPDSVLFNNLIINNGGLTGQQVSVNYIPGFGSVSVPMPWQSRNNLIVSQGTQLLGIVQPPAVGAQQDIYNLKEWFAAVGQDAPGESVSYPTQFTANPFYPDANEEVWGHGTAAFYTQTAPGLDMQGQTRPLVGELQPDPGPVEQVDSSQFHHISLTAPSAIAGLVGDTLTVNAEFQNSRNVRVPGQPTQRLYFYLSAGNPFTVEPTGVITSPSLTLQATVTPGLFYVDPASVPPAMETFQVNVSRSELQGRSNAFRLRILEWEDWYAVSAAAFGGRADTGVVLRWYAPAQAQASSATAPSPVLASGRPQDYARIQMTILDSSGNPVSGLVVGDFTFSVSGGNYNLDLSTFIEDAFNPGTYFINLMSDQVGIKTVTISANGALLNDQPQIEFQPGIFGVVSDSAGSLPPDMQVQITDASGTVLGTALTSLTGEYSIRIPQVTNQRYVVTVTDPAGRYTQAERVLTLPSDTALQVDFILDSQRPTRLDGHAYPNPAARGSNITIRYDLPTPGPFRLEIFDLRGRRLITLIDTHQPAGPGRIVWQAVNRFGKQLAPGTYLIVMRFEGKTITKKIVIIP